MSSHADTQALLNAARAADAREAALLAENQRLREEILRCGALAISERADGCVPKTRALQIRKVAYELTSREALAGDADD